MRNFFVPVFLGLLLLDLTMATACHQSRRPVATIDAGEWLAEVVRSQQRFYVPSPCAGATLTDKVSIRHRLESDPQFLRVVLALKERPYSYRQMLFAACLKIRTPCDPGAPDLPKSAETEVAEETVSLAAKMVDLVSPSEIASKLGSLP